jgi:hypothetical protein
MVRNRHILINGLTMKLGGSLGLYVSWMASLEFIDLTLLIRFSESTLMNLL